MKILVVDDKQENLYLLGTLIKGSGYDVVSAAHGEEALKILHTENIDLIVSDILMPVMDGYQFCREVKKDKNFYSIPFIFYTATYTDENDETLALKLGADRFIRKPFEPEEFLKVIDTVLKEKKRKKQKFQKLTTAKEKEIFKLYDGRLVKKLEKKMLDLEQEMNERKRLEKELQESERKYRSLIVNANDIIIDVTIDGIIKFVSPQITRYGFTPEEMVSRNFLDYIFKEDRKRVMHDIERTFSTGEEFPTEFRVEDKAGVIHWFEDYGKIQTDESENPVGLIAIMRDVTERKKLECMLLDSEERYRTIFETTGSALAIIEKDTTISLVNEEFERLSGYSKKEIEGKKSWTEFIVKEDLDKMLQYHKLRRIASDDAPKSYEFRYNDAGGNVRDVLLNIALIPHTKKSIASLLDMTQKIQDEKIIKKRNTQLSIAMEIARLGYWEYDVADDMFTFNDHFYAIFRTTAEKVGGYTMSSTQYAENFVHPDDREMVAIEIRKAIETTDPHFSQQLEHRIIYADGEIGYINVQINIVKNTKDRTIKTYGVNQDITESKKAEEGLILFRSLIDQSNDTIEVMDPETGRFLDVNEKGCMELGYSQKEYLSLSVFDIDPDVDQSVFIRSIEEIKKKGALLWEGIHRRKDGSTFPVEVNMKYVRLKKDYVITVVRDITERKRTEEVRIRLETAIEQSDDSIVITDRDGIIQYVNPSFQRITGYTREEALGENPRILKSGKHNKTFYKKLWKTITGGDVWNGHFINKKKDGTLYEEEASISPVKDNKGGIINFVAVKRDITEEIKMEKNLREAQKMEAIGTLAGGIAHDFNNILSGVIGYTELAMEDISKDTQLYSDLNKVLKAGFRARDLVTQILTFSRRHDEEKQPIQIGSLIKETLRLLRASIPTTIEFRQNIETDEKYILGDPTQIHQVLMNLCTNAAHAMSEKGGILEVCLTAIELDADFANLHPGISPGSYQKLTVSDTGNGIKPELLNRIFEPYFTTKEKGGGTGLGLAVVHGIVESYGGTITIDSEPGRGTTFYVYFPVIEGKSITEIEKPDSISTGNERILIVDDEQMIVDMGERILGSLGYEVIARTNSIEALELFSDNPDGFDLVITDMTMPYMTGDELAEKLLHIRPDIPIIINTGFSERITEEQAKSKGIRAFVMKPINKEKLAETVRQVLDQK